MDGRLDRFEAYYKDAFDKIQNAEKQSQSLVVGDGFMGSDD